MCGSVRDPAVAFWSDGNRLRVMSRLWGEREWVWKIVRRNMRSTSRKDDALSNNWNRAERPIPWERSLCSHFRSFCGRLVSLVRCFYSSFLSIRFLRLFHTFSSDRHIYSHFSFYRASARCPCSSTPINLHRPFLLSFLSIYWITEINYFICINNLS
jgi:hypothetical protein